MPEIEHIQPVAMVAGLVLLLLWEQAHPFFDYFRGRGRERGRHVLRNLILGGLNALLVAVLFAGLWYAAAEWTASRGLGLFHWLESETGVPL